jgi:ferric-dicitrate binding protein FerR (iron transport regulator)
MKQSQVTFGPCLLLLISLAFFPTLPHAQSGSHAPHVVGRITALLPEDHVLRADKTLVAAKDMELLVDDVVKTDRGGRVRIALSDGSILNVGSDAQLRILQHDVKHQETTLELLYGRLLLTAVKISKPHGKFEVRTPVAVAGVVGTKFGLRAESSSADVVCKEGTVRVRNTDSSVPGEVLLQAGQFTHVERGKPPSPPAPASPERIQAGEDATSIPD